MDAPGVAREWRSRSTPPSPSRPPPRVVVEGTLLVGEGRGGPSPVASARSSTSTCRPVREERLRRRHAQTYGDTAAAGRGSTPSSPNAVIVERWRSAADVVVADFPVPGSTLLSVSGGWCRPAPLDGAGDAAGSGVGRLASSIHSTYSRWWENDMASNASPAAGSAATRHGGRAARSPSVAVTPHRA